MLFINETTPFGTFKNLLRSLIDGTSFGGKSFGGKSFGGTSFDFLFLLAADEFADGLMFVFEPVG